MINFSNLLRYASFTKDSSEYRQIKKRITKAREMSKNGYSLWGQLRSDTALGVIKSQSSSDKYYFCYLRADGSYGCFDDSFNPCLGLPHYTPYRYDYDFEWDIDWHRGQPCKHIFSMINGFCAQGGRNIQDILREWLKITFIDIKRPNTDQEIAQYIQSLFNQVSDQVLGKTIFKRILEPKSSNFAYYRPSTKVKILDPIKEESSQIIELHLEISSEGVKSLPLKNIKCISCLQSENRKEILEDWFKCKYCLNAICSTCYLLMEEERKTENNCPSYFIGIRKHPFYELRFFDEVKEYEIKKEKKLPEDQDIVFSYGLD